MAKLTDFQTLTGAKGNLFDIKSMWGLILGMVVTFFVIATGQNLAKKVSSRIPAFDTSISPVIDRPVSTTAGTQKVYL